MPSAMRAALVPTAVLLAATSLHAQAPAPDSVPTRRFRFAESFFGADAIGLGSSGGALPLPARVLPRVTIGGLHFWGRADLAVLIPVAGAEREVTGVRTRYSSGIETRARYLFRPLDHPNWSPYVGAALGGVDVRVADGPRVFRYRPVTQVGVAVRTRRTLFEAGWSYRPGAALRYPTARNQFTTLDPSPHAWTLGVHRLVETTALLEGEVARGVIAARETRWRADGRLSGPSLAFGPTSLMLTGGTQFNATQRPWLAPRPRATPSFDLGVGWYDDAHDLHANAALRRGTFTTSAYDFTQRNTRESIALETFKFLGDYHGFVPFVGPVVSLERLRVREQDGGTSITDVERTFVAPGVTFGWDIRPTRTQPIILRTNLRWFPRLRVAMPGGEQQLDQLEFNFIQVVWYPRRRG